MTASHNNKKGLLIFAFLASLLSVMAVLKYHNLNSTYFDLGVFLSNFYMISVGQWQRIYLTHVQPYSLIFSLPYQILPGFLLPPVILIAQASLLAFPVIGLYKHYGIIPTIAFALYFPLWYNALFDFHIDHLAVPLLFGFFFFERQGKTGLAILMAVLLTFVKEIFSLQAAFCGLFLLFIRKKRIAGACLFVFGIIYYLIATHYFLKYFNFSISNFTSTSSSEIFLHPLNLMRASGAEVLNHVLSNFHLIIWEILTNPDKMKYLLYIFVALGFIPLLSPGILLTTLPILAGSLLFQTKGYYGYTHHYTAGLIAPMIIAFAEGLPVAKKYWEKLKLPPDRFIPLILAGLFLCHVLASPSPIGRKFYRKKAWFHHNSVYKFQERNKWIKSVIKKYIPFDPNIILSVQNTLNWGHLAQRQTVFVFPHGATQPSVKVDASEKSMSGVLDYILTGEIKNNMNSVAWADYVVLDLRRPWFIGDRGCEWVEEKCVNAMGFEEEFLGLVSRARLLFETIYENDKVVILKRRE